MRYSLVSRAPHGLPALRIRAAAPLALVAGPEPELFTSLAATVADAVCTPENELSTIGKDFLVFLAAIVATVPLCKVCLHL